ncbi:FixH family protein [Bacillus sp. 2205SS5-2]|uniref:FixH family protein n=1 Tax=Bacillus sp. 2205SS5-2 TaxID=3109031 RepID=UPI003005DDBC
MKKNNGIWMIVIAVTLLLAACGNDDKQSQAENNTEAPVAIAAELQVPESGNIGEGIEFSTKVKQGDELVDDADEVKYEIWMDGQKDDSEMIDAEKSDKGHYVIEKTFEMNGKYIVQVHVTARGLHTMPKSEILIGDGEMDNNGDHQEHLDSSIHFMKPENPVAGEETMLMAHVEVDGQPLSDAEVRFEIKVDGAKAEWVETISEVEGEYKAIYAFSQKGHYTVVVHAEKGEEIHDHVEEMVMVGE